MNASDGSFDQNSLFQIVRLNRKAKRGDSDASDFRIGIWGNIDYGFNKILLIEFILSKLFLLYFNEYIEFI